MIKEIIHDPLFLALKSIDATKNDINVAMDLLDTLKAHKDTCVGMAANMIGVNKRIICFILDDGSYLTMLNPTIIKKSNPYDTYESCLSLLGGSRPTKRFKEIKVQYETLDFKVRIKTFKNFEAQIIQHEIDHCEGILI